ncbi:hypothetical protein HY734_02145 [Candidatus Uhrbacteria bacterium]|nr:hypothetical protein [Candidatus Uhrbacteria bacterium]
MYGTKAIMTGIRRRIMPKRSIRAVQREDGRLELLEPVTIPHGRVIEVSLELPEENKHAHPPVSIPCWKGTVIGTLSRDEIYADR